jgi:hypothetical protein
MGTLHFRRIERRRTARVALCVELIILGETGAGGKFKADARTVSVSGHGGMMVLEVDVALGQTLTLINTNSAQKVDCKVVAVKDGHDGKKHVAFEFSSSGLNFWKMCFPMAGTRPMRRPVKTVLATVPAAKVTL